MGVTVYDGLPFEGADVRSVVLKTVSGTSTSPGVGMYGTKKDATGKAVMDKYRLQIDCNYDDRQGCTQLADLVEQEIWKAHDTLRDTYDIHGLQKMLDVDSLALGQSLRLPVLTREARIILDFMYWTHRTLAT
jgi:hypothetical protein